MSEAPKGLVICGGKGSRLRPLTYTGAKQLVPIANKPIVFYALEQLVEAGITDISIVVSPETGDQVRGSVGDGSRFGARIGYIEQLHPGGIAQAIGLARDAMGDGAFVAFLGDNFLTHGIVSHVQKFIASGADGAILLKHVPDASQFGVAQFDGERLVRVVEKPEHPPSDLAVIGIYMFRRRVWDAIAGIRPSARGELEITDTIQWLLDHGSTISAEVVEGQWIDTGKHDDLLEANRIVLEMMTEDQRLGAVDEASRIEGCVVLQSGSSIVNSSIRGPAIIGERTLIRNSRVGPYTSIDHDCVVSDSEIANSVVLEYTRLERVGHPIEQSLIGRNVELFGDDHNPDSYRLTLGDFSRGRVPR